MITEICKTKIPPRKQQPCLVQSVEKSVASQNQQPNEPQAQQMENLVEGQRVLPLTKGMFAIVDDDKYEELSKHKWSATNCANSFYARRTGVSPNGVKNIAVYMHRQLIGAKKGQIVDHINGNKLDNRVSNLRIVTTAENCREFCKIKENKTSKYRGVYRRWDNKKWTAQIMIFGKMNYIGCFNDEKEAAKAYNAKAIQLGFLPEALNKI